MLYTVYCQVKIFNSRFVVPSKNIVPLSTAISDQISVCMFDNTCASATIITWLMSLQFGDSHLPLFSL